MINRINREVLEKEFQLEKKYSIETVNSIANNIENSIIFNENNGITLYIKGIEKMTGEYRVDYICKFVKNDNDEYIINETLYKEVITNPFLLDYTKPIGFLIIVLIISYILFFHRYW